MIKGSKGKKMNQVQLMVNFSILKCTVNYKCMFNIVLVKTLPLLALNVCLS